MDNIYNRRQGAKSIIVSVRKRMQIAYRPLRRHTYVVSLIVLLVVVVVNA